MGVNKMLKAGIAEETELLAKSKKGSEEKEKKEDPKATITGEKIKQSQPKKEKKATGKNKGGRPPKAKHELRKQYTLTLPPETYEIFKNKAHADGDSFARYVEKAVWEYINNHQ